MMFKNLKSINSSLLITYIILIIIAFLAIIVTSTSLVEAATYTCDSTKKLIIEDLRQSDIITNNDNCDIHVKKGKFNYYFFPDMDRGSLLIEYISCDGQDACLYLKSLTNMKFVILRHMTKYRRNIGGSVSGGAASLIRLDNKKVVNVDLFLIENCVMDFYCENTLGSGEIYFFYLDGDPSHPSIIDNVKNFTFSNNTFGSKLIEIKTWLYLGFFHGFDYPIKNSKFYFINNNYNFHRLQNEDKFITLHFFHLNSHIHGTSMIFDNNYFNATFSFTAPTKQDRRVIFFKLHATDFNGKSNSQIASALKIKNSTMHVAFDLQVSSSNLADPNIFYVRFVNFQSGTNVKNVSTILLEDSNLKVSSVHANSTEVLDVALLGCEKLMNAVQTLYILKSKIEIEDLGLLRAVSNVNSYHHGRPWRKMIVITLNLCSSGTCNINVDEFRAISSILINEPQIIGVIRPTNFYEIAFFSFVGAKLKDCDFLSVTDGYMNFNELSQQLVDATDGKDSKVSAMRLRGSVDTMRSLSILNTHIIIANVTAEASLSTDSQANLQILSVAGPVTKISSSMTVKDCSLHINSFVTKKGLRFAGLVHFEETATLSKIATILIKNIFFHCESSVALGGDQIQLFSVLHEAPNNNDGGYFHIENNTLSLGSVNYDNALTSVAAFSIFAKTKGTSANFVNSYFVMKDCQILVRSVSAKNQGMATIVFDYGGGYLQHYQYFKIQSCSIMLGDVSANNGVYLYIARFQRSDTLNTPAVANIHHGFQILDSRINVSKSIVMKKAGASVTIEILKFFDYPIQHVSFIEVSGSEVFGSISSQHQILLYTSSFSTSINNVSKFLFTSNLIEVAAVAKNEKSYLYSGAYFTATCGMSLHESFIFDNCSAIQRNFVSSSSSSSDIISGTQMMTFRIDKWSNIPVNAPRPSFNITNCVIRGENLRVATTQHLFAAHCYFYPQLTDFNKFSISNSVVELPNYQVENDVSVFILDFKLGVENSAETNKEYVTSGIYIDNCEVKVYGEKKSSGGGSLQTEARAVLVEFTYESVKNINVISVKNCLLSCRTAGNVDAFVQALSSYYQSGSVFQNIQSVIVDNVQVSAGSYQNKKIAGKWFAYVVFIAFSASNIDSVMINNCHISSLPPDDSSVLQHHLSSTGQIISSAILYFDDPDSADIIGIRSLKVTLSTITINFEAAPGKNVWFSITRSDGVIDSKHLQQQTGRDKRNTIFDVSSCSINVIGNVSGTTESIFVIAVYPKGMIGWNSIKISNVVLIGTLSGNFKQSVAAVFYDYATSTTESWNSCQEISFEHCDVDFSSFSLSNLGGTLDVIVGISMSNHAIINVGSISVLDSTISLNKYYATTTEEEGKKDGGRIGEGNYLLPETSTTSYFNSGSLLVSFHRNIESATNISNITVRGGIIKIYPRFLTSSTAVSVVALRQEGFNSGGDSSSTFFRDKSFMSVANVNMYVSDMYIDPISTTSSTIFLRIAAVNVINVLSLKKILITNVRFFSNVSANEQKGIVGGRLGAIYSSLMILSCCNQIQDMLIQFDNNVIISSFFSAISDNNANIPSVAFFSSTNSSVLNLNEFTFNNNSILSPPPDLLSDNDKKSSAVIFANVHDDSNTMRYWKCDSCTVNFDCNKWENAINIDYYMNLLRSVATVNEIKCTTTTTTTSTTTATFLTTTNTSSTNNSVTNSSTTQSDSSTSSHNHTASTTNFSDISSPPPPTSTSTTTTRVFNTTNNNSQETTNAQQKRTKTFSITKSLTKFLEKQQQQFKLQRSTPEGIRTSTSVVSMVASSSTLANAGNKLSSLSQMQTCGSVDDVTGEPLPPPPVQSDQNYLGFLIGDNDDHLQTYRGAILSGVVVFISVFVGNFFVGLFRMKFPNNNKMKRKTNKHLTLADGLGKSRFPGYSGIIIQIVSSPLSSCTATIISYSPGMNMVDVVVVILGIIFGIIVPLCWISYLVYMSTKEEWKCIPVKKEKEEDDENENSEEKQNNNNNKNKKNNEKQDSKKNNNNINNNKKENSETKTKGESKDKQEKEGSSNSSSNAVVRLWHYLADPLASWDKKASQTIRLNGAFFDSYSSIKFLLIEQITLNVVSLCNGISIACVSKSCCTMSIVFALIAASFHTISVITLKCPYTTRTEIFVNSTVSVLTCGLGLIVLIKFFGGEFISLDIVNVFTTLCFTFGLSGLFVAVLYSFFLPFFFASVGFCKSTTGKKQKEENDENKKFAGYNNNSFLDNSSSNGGDNNDDVPLLQYSSRNKKHNSSKNNHRSSSNTIANNDNTYFSPRENQFENDVDALVVTATNRGRNNKNFSHEKEKTSSSSSDRSRITEKNKTRHHHHDHHRSSSSSSSSSSRHRDTPSALAAAAAAAASSLSPQQQRKKALKNFQSTITLLDGNDSNTARLQKEMSAKIATLMQEQQEQEQKEQNKKSRTPSSSSGNKSSRSGRTAIDTSEI